MNDFLTYPEYLTICSILAMAVGVVGIVSLLVLFLIRFCVKCYKHRKEIKRSQIIENYNEQLRQLKCEDEKKLKLERLFHRVTAIENRVATLADFCDSNYGDIELLKSRKK